MNHDNTTVGEHHERSKSIPIEQDNPVLVPHPPITKYYANESERAEFLQGIFDETGSEYDRIESILALGSGSWYRRQALLRAGLKPGMKVVDVGFGTGLVAKEAIKVIEDADLLIGIDPSAGMIKASPLHGQVTILDGRAEEIPLPESSCDFISMGYALRHISDLNKAFREFHRVLKPDGRLCILEITKPRSFFSIWLLKVYMRVIVPIFARMVAKNKRTSLLWRYYWDSIEACANPAEIIEAIKHAGFIEVNQHLIFGIFSEFQAKLPQNEAV